MKKHILITGGTGFIASYLVKELEEAGYLVTSVSRSGKKITGTHKLDLSNPYDINKFVRNIKKIDIIIHCAAIAHGEEPPVGFTIPEFNSLLVKNLVKAFNYQPHWIFLSSISVYGDNKQNSFLPLEIYPKTDDPYGRGKLFDENLLISLCHQLDILRLMPTYDSLDNNDVRKRVFIPKTNVKLKIIPSPLYNLCHIERIKEAVLVSMENPKGRRIHQIGDKDKIKQKDLLRQFNGIYVVIPQIFFRTLLFILPKSIKSFKKIRMMLIKLAVPNNYELGSIQLNKKDDQTIK